MMPKATVTIETGKDPKDYIEIIGKKLDFKRSKVRMSRKGRQISALVESNDSRALLAALQSLMKQLRIVNSVDKMLDEMAEKYK